MPEISITDARNLFTKKLIAVYREQVQTTSFLRSFFKVVETMSKEVSIEVERGFEKVAVDVLRSTEGNRNVFDKSTEKIFLPPLYWEFLTATDNRLYDVAIGYQSEAAFAELSKQLGIDLFKLQQKIERAIELQCAQFLETGIVQLNAGTNIDFKRKALSMLDGTSVAWNNNANNPITQIADDCVWIRKEGKVQGNIFNILMGSDAKRAFDNNTNVKTHADIRRMNYADLREPQRNQIGGTSHGEVSCGDYVVRIWTYGEYYTNASGVATPYLNPKKVIVLPDDPNFLQVFAAVPQLLGPGGSVPQNGAYLISEHLDEKKASHEIHIKSAPVVVPVGIDQVRTRQVLS